MHDRKDIPQGTLDLLILRVKVEATRWNAIAMAVARVMERLMDAWSRVRTGATGASLDMIAQDLRYSWRALRSSPAHAAWIVGSLAIGMAVTVAALVVLNAVQFLPFPEVREQHRLARVALLRNCGRPDCWSPMAAPADYAAARRALTGLQGLAAYASADVTIALPDARAMQAVLASDNYFDVLGVFPALGRPFSAADAAAHADVVVIADRLWRREFDADPAVIGRFVRAGRRSVQIVGVAPPFFEGVERPRLPGPRRIGVGTPPDVWLPMWLADDLSLGGPADHASQGPTFQFVGRLQDDVEIPRLEAEAGAVARGLAASGAAPSVGARAEVLRVWRVNPRNWGLGIALVMPVPLLVLAIACVNAANLLLARGSQRQREMAILLAIGASRGRIVRQLLLESAMLALLATAVAVPIASWALQLAATPWGIPLPLDRTVLALTAGIAVMTTVAFGLAPAIRVTSQEPKSALGAVTARSDAGPAQSWMRRALLAGQIALSLALLATGSQLVWTVRSEAVAAGTAPDRLLIARFDLRRLNEPHARIDDFYRELLAGASRLPGVEAAGLARQTAVWSFGEGTTSASVRAWRADDGPQDGQVMAGGMATGDLFGVVGLRMLEGRGFTDADRLTRPQVAVVNQSAARALDGPALGQVLRVGPRDGDFSDATEVRIVGVLESSREPRMERGEPPTPRVYLPSPVEAEPALSLYVRTTGDAPGAARSVRDLVSRLDPRVPVLDLSSLKELNERSYVVQLWLARAATLLGAIGLLLATAGLYGVASYLVTLRSRELAIRMVVGAAPLAILGLVLRQSFGVAGAGLLAGSAAALGASRWVQSEYHGVLGINGAAFTAAVGLFLAAMLLASVIPALRASRLDPVENLKDV